MSEPIKVLHVLEAVEGGTARHLRDLVTYGEGASHAVIVPRERHGHFTDFDALADIQAAATQTINVDMRRSAANWRNPVAVARTAAFARRWSPDVIHGHSSIGGVAARLVGSTRDSAVVWTPNGVLTNRSAVTIERALSRLTDRIIAVSASEAILLRELSIASERQLATIPNGIELDPTFANPPSLRELCGIPADAPIVGCIGRLSEQKGIDTFVETARVATRSDPSVWFVLIGSGDDLAHLARDAAAEMPRFAWLDGLPQARAILEQLSVFVLLSRYEGLPYALMEAMAAGRACVVTNAVGNRDIVTDGESGVLVPINDASAAATAVVRLLADDRARQRLGAAAKDQAAAFDARIMAKRTVALYRQCLDARA